MSCSARHVHPPQIRSHPPAHTHTYTHTHKHKWTRASSPRIHDLRYGSRSQAPAHRGPKLQRRCSCALYARRCFQWSAASRPPLPDAACLHESGRQGESARELHGRRQARGRAKIVGPGVSLQSVVVFPALSSPGERGRIHIRRDHELRTHAHLNSAPTRARIGRAPPSPATRHSPGVVREVQTPAICTLPPHPAPARCMRPCTRPRTPKPLARAGQRVGHLPAHGMPPPRGPPPLRLRRREVCAAGVWRRAVAVGGQPRAGRRNTPRASCTLHR